MKHILDSSFRYKPSFDTDVRTKHLENFDQEIAGVYAVACFGEFAVQLLYAFNVSSLNRTHERRDLAVPATQGKSQRVNSIILQEEIDCELSFAQKPFRLIHHDPQTFANIVKVHESDAVLR